MQQQQQQGWQQLSQQQQLSRHRTSHDLYGSLVPMKDPGNTGTITVDRSPTYLDLVSAGAETRTLARPTKQGALCILSAKTIGGTITVTVTGGFDIGGTTTFALSAVKQWVIFVSAYDGTNFYWRKVADYTIGNLTPTVSAFLAGVTAGTAAASKALVLDSSSNIATINNLTATGITLGDGTTIGTGGVVTVAPATTTLTLTPAAHGNRLLSLAPTGGLALTPPAATGTGLRYRFVFTAAVSGGNFTFDAKAGNAGDQIEGWLQTYKATTFTPYVSAGNDNLITLNGTTTGAAAAGDWFEVQDAGTNLWIVTGGFATQSGVIATPFSHH